MLDMHDDQVTSFQGRAEPQSFFAAERTFLAWIRTGLSLMGLGFVVARFSLFLREIAVVRIDAPPPTGVSRWLGVSLIVLGAILIAGSARSYLATVRRLERGEVYVGAPTRLGVATAAVLVVLGVLMTMYLAFWV